MVERNACVAFPELLAPERTLEGVVVDMAYGNLIPFNQLPNSMSAGNIETYANWVSELTQKDSACAERGAVLHVRTDNECLIYPSNPDVGDEYGVGWVISKKRNKFIPTINIHSHPTDICHSPSLADVSTLISGFGVNEEHFTPSGMLVATPGHNYLMLKSQETPAEEKWDIYKKDYEMFDQDEFRRFRRYGSRHGQTMSLISYWKLYEQAEKLLGIDFESYYNNFVRAINLSEEYNIGFYRSNKDGNYIRLNRLMVMEQVTQKLDEMLTAAIRPLPQKHVIFSNSS